MVFVSTCNLFVTGLEGYRVFVGTWMRVLECITPTEKKNETEKCKTILSGDVNAPSVRACFHLTAFYSG
jgi:hypothetical protein